MPRYTAHTLLALAFTLVVWASAFAGIRAGLRAYSPANLAILRFLIASLVLAFYAAIAHFRRPELSDLPGLVITGAIGISFYNLALNYGERIRNVRSNGLTAGLCSGRTHLCAFVDGQQGPRSGHER